MKIDTTIPAVPGIAIVFYVAGVFTPRSGEPKDFLECAYRPLSTITMSAEQIKTLLGICSQMFPQEVGNGQAR